MPTVADLSLEADSRAQFLDSLPSHQTMWPPQQRPETWLELPMVIV